MDHFGKPNGQQSHHRMSESKRNSTIELKSENELLRREVERQKNQISTLEATLCELQSKNAKLEEIVVALQRSAVNHNGESFFLMVSHFFYESFFLIRPTYPQKSNEMV